MGVMIQPLGDVLYTLVIHSAKIDSNPLTRDCEASNNRAQVSVSSSGCFFDKHICHLYLLDSLVFLNLYIN